MISNESLYQFVKHHESPCYVYDASRIRRNYEALKNALPENFKILYSLKANSNPFIIRELKKLGSSFDVASYNELKTVLECGVPPEEISFVGPGKTEGEIRFALKERVGMLVVESLDQLALVNKCASEANLVQNISIRVNPREYYDQRGRKRVDRSIQFGIDEENLAAVFEELKKMPSLRVLGIHTHVQSQILEAEPIVKNFALTLQIFKDLKAAYAPELSVINFGGGFGIPYNEKEKELDLEALRRGLTEFSTLRPPLRPYVETGRFLVGQSGYFITKVLYRKESRGKKILIMDGGMNNNFSVVGALQFEGKRYAATALTGRPATEFQKYTLVGPSCYSMDVLATDLELPEMRPGDYVCFHNSGSYGRSFSPILFLGQKVAQEYYLDGNTCNGELIH